MKEKLKQASKEAFDFLYHQGLISRYGDITVTITMNNGVPVKLTKCFCEHLSKRKTDKLTSESDEEKELVFS